MTRAYSIKVEDVAAEQERAQHDPKKLDISRVIKLDELKLADMGRSDVRLQILAASVEHNVCHAALADTVNIAELRGGKIYPGNSAVGYVIEVGADVKKFKVGDVVLTHANGDPDRFGYPKVIWAYDTPDSIGWYAEEAVVGDWQLVKAPLDCGLNLWEIAALPLRAPTAYHLWRRAEGIFRLKVPVEQLATINVMGFGGGVSELFLMLAKSKGHNAFFCSGSKERREFLEQLGIIPIDQRAFNRFADRNDIKAFIGETRNRTGGEGMHIICDMLRGPVFSAGFGAAAREGVIVSAGWQLERFVEYNSASASIKEITLDHTHLETIAGIHAATELYGRVFKPTVHEDIYEFEDLPRALAEMHQNVQTGIPIIRVAKEMPEVVAKLID
jgi:NADPH:quinone reductase-like Zn-dependent oxidoreductase